MNNCEHFNEKGAFDEDTVYVDHRYPSGARCPKRKIRVWDGNPEGKFLSIAVAGYN